MTNTPDTNDKNQILYIYKLGHCQELAVAEYLSLTGLSPKSIRVVDDYIFGYTKLDVNLSGSLVYGGQVLCEYDFETGKNLINTQEQLAVILANLEIPKKMGLSLDCPITLTQVLKITKPLKIKNTLLINRTTPNIGHWKQNQFWVCQVKIGNINYIYKIDSYFDQEFWAKLDMALPCGDMKRGIINLKLARSLNNLTRSKNIWDPFCGSGRNMVSSFDIKNYFWMDDLAPICIDQEVPTNIKFLREFLPKFGKSLAEDAIKGSRTISASDSKFESGTLAGIDDKNVSIVTEGWLGTNITEQLIPATILKDYLWLSKVWKSIIDKASLQEFIQEIVFCLPYHLNFSNISDDHMSQVNSWLNDSKFRIIKLGDRTDYIIYKRAKTKVAHAVFKLVRR